MKKAIIFGLALLLSPLLFAQEIGTGRLEWEKFMRAKPPEEGLFYVRVCPEDPEAKPGEPGHGIYMIEFYDELKIEDRKKVRIASIHQGIPRKKNPRKVKWVPRTQDLEDGVEQACPHQGNIPAHLEPRVLRFDRNEWPIFVERDETGEPIVDEFGRTKAVWMFSMSVTASDDGRSGKTIAYMVIPHSPPEIPIHLNIRYDWIPKDNFYSYELLSTQTFVW